MKSYFVTGATGVVGSALVPVLLEDPDSEVWLLVRARDAHGLASRVDDLFRFWQFGDAEHEKRTRVHAMLGDVVAPQLGTARHDYEALLARVTHIVHAAGAVRMNLPIEDARKTAVGSAQQVVDLAWALQRSGQLQKVEFVSTVGVGGHLPVVPETWIDEPRRFHNTYEQAKAEAEALVRGHVERGLRLTVHRPSMVVGDSRTGRIVHFQIFYYLCEFLSGRRTRGFFPPLEQARVDVVPSDYVARAIDWSSRTGEAAGRVLHLCAGDRAIRLLELSDAVRRQMRARGLSVPEPTIVPGWLFRGAAALAARIGAGKSRAALRALPIFLDYLATVQEFGALNTRAVLPPGVVGDAPCWNAWLGRVLDYYLEQRYPLI